MNIAEELAASQAREQVLLNLSNELLRQIDINDFTDSHGHSAKMLKAVHNLTEHNSKQTDDTALKAALAAERERCIAAVDAADDCGCGVPCDCYSVGTAIYAIRALGDQ